MANKFATFQDYRIVQDENDTITVMQFSENGKFQTFDVTKPKLREIVEDFNCDASRISEFEYDDEWNTRRLGSKLIDHLNKLDEIWNWWLSLSDSLKYILLSNNIDYKGLYELPEYDAFDGFEITASEVDLTDRENFALLLDMFDSNEIYCPEYIDLDFDDVEKLAYMPNLESLYLDNVSLNFIPAGIFELTKLKKLSFASNSDFVEGCERENLLKLSALKNLEELNFEYTRVESNWEEIEKLRKLLPNCHFVF